MSRRSVSNGDPRVSPTLLGSVAFLSGAAVMALELVGSRILAPHIGTSLPVWTSLIGVILACLSFGYYLGGRISDRRASAGQLARFLFAAGVLIAMVAVGHGWLMRLLVGAMPDIRISSVVATLILFGAPSVLLGTVAPYVVRLRADSMTNLGATVGGLYALSTMGSIVGTFASGFYLIPYLGNTRLLILLAVVLVGLSLVVGASSGRTTKIFALAVLVAIGSFGAKWLGVNDGQTFETRYGSVRILEEEMYGEPMKLLEINSQASSVMSLRDDLAIFGYVEYFDLARHFNPKLERALMIGGAAYSYPRYFLSRVPAGRIDVVELDPQVTELARRFFKLTDLPGLRIFHQDGRVFLNRSRDIYDAVLVDAYSAVHTLPYQLTTREAVEAMADRLTAEGVVVVNMISALDGPASKFLRAELATYRSVFPHVFVFRVHTDDPLQKQNLILVAAKRLQPGWRQAGSRRMQQLLANRWTGRIRSDLPVLTDDRAPVERYLTDAL